MDNREEFIKEFMNMLPGKYWKLPKNKKNMRTTVLNDSSYYGSVKNDGEWARMIIGENQILIQSRSISKVTGEYGDKTAHLQHLLAEAKELFPSGTVVLGEICYDDPSKTSKDVGSILRCLPEKGIERQIENGFLKFKIFDILCDNYVNTFELPASERRILVEKMETGEYITTTEFSDNPEELVEKVFARGGEGIVLMKKSEPYKFGNAKAWHSIKIKKALEDFEAPVIGLSEAKKDYEGSSLEDWKFWEVTDTDGLVMKVNRPMHAAFSTGMVVSINDKNIVNFRPITENYFNDWPAGVIVNHNGTEVVLASGVTHDDAEYLKQNGFDGLVAVYSGMEITEEGSIRHPYLVRLRNDA